MGIIRALSPSVINQIAAGEVIERPASVLKELLENAIDSGASRVDVSVERGGKDLIRVADDGKGMDADDLLLAFQPHATSKLKEPDDLFKIATLGFRGEALAAIAEVSKVRCQTREADAPHGLELSIEGGVAGEIRECSGTPGTVFEVRQLFFNTPVRRTFLKADSTEAGHVTDMFTRIALAHPAVHLTFRSGGKVLYDLPASTGIKDRIATFFGREMADTLIWVESRVEQTHLWGYVANPEQSRSNTKGQFLFVGGRFVRDRSLGHALSEAYRGLVMVGRSPIAFLNLEVPPDEVDVNVHPTKIEVRFRDSQRIYSQLLATIREAFLGSDLHARLHAPPPTPPAPSPWSSNAILSMPEPPPLRLNSWSDRKQEVSSWFAPPTQQAFQSFPQPGYAGGPPVPEWSHHLPNPATTARAFDEFSGEEATSNPDPATDATTTGNQPAEAYSPERVADESAQLLARSMSPRAIQIHDSYLVAETDEGLVVIDQHALHERILYEEFKARVERGGVESQRFLVPEPVELTQVGADELLLHKELLARLGLEIEPFGGGTVLVLSAPAMLGGVEPERLVAELAEHFRSSPLPPTADGLLEGVLNMLACKAAVKAGQKLDPEEVAALLSRRHLAANTHHCPHGRPTALTFTKAELERQFGRI
ncbi:DNA mismatch repair endonuclease MutL [Isosphaeraceae bacterium EP7]